MKTVSSNPNSENLILIALRHLQASISAGDTSPAHLQELLNGDVLSKEHIPQIDSICERINLGAENEHYTVVCMSTAHLTPDDQLSLSRSIREGNQMMFKRDTGYFVKLFDEMESNIQPGYSKSLIEVFTWAHSEGYGMIELDADAGVIPALELYE